MHSTPQDYSIFDKFNFERKPIGIKYLFNKPDGMEQLDKELALCEMLKEAQGRGPFYAARENIGCLGPLLLGMEEHDPIFESGQVGPRDGIFKEARANKRAYQYIPRLPKGTVNYMAVSPLDQLSFEPDILFVIATASQAEILLRARTYTTGKMLSAKSTPVIMCAWLFIYPYVSGELNFTVTGLGTGMKSRQVLPEGLMLLSIPYDMLPMMIENLQDMEWVLPIYTMSEDERNAYFKNTSDELRKASGG